MLKFCQCSYLYVHYITNNVLYNLKWGELQHNFRNMILSDDTYIQIFQKLITGFEYH
jgi:hypothetical protein